MNLGNPITDGLAALMAVLGRKRKKSARDALEELKTRKRDEKGRFAA